MDRKDKKSLLFFMMVLAAASGACAKKSLLKAKQATDTSIFGAQPAPDANDVLKKSNSKLNSSIAISTPKATPTALTPSPVAEVPPLLKKIPDMLYPLKALLPGIPLTIDFNNMQKGEPGDDIGMSYFCTVFPQSNLAISYPCVIGDGVLFDTKSGVLVVNPTIQSVGTYKVKISGANSAGISFSEFMVSVRDPYSQQNLLVDLDARFSGILMPALPNFTSWANLADTSNLAKLSGVPRWNGDGSKQNPFRHDFNQGGNSNRLDLGNSTSSKTRLAFTMLGSVTSPSTLGSIIAGTIAKFSTGWSLRQSMTKPGKLELVAGQSYQDLILSHKPVGYWRMNESSGNVAKDISGNNNNANYSSVYTLGDTTPLVNDASSGVNFNGGTMVAPPSSSLRVQNTMSVSLWVKPNGNGYYNPFLNYGKTRWGVNIGSACGSWWGGDPKQVCVGMVDSNQVSHAFYSNSATNPLMMNQWNHVVVTYDGSVGRIYINGSLAVSQSIGTFLLATDEQVNVGYLPIGGACWWGAVCAFPGGLTEVAIFSEPLSPEAVIQLYQAAQGKSGSVCYSKNTISENLMTTFAGVINPNDATSGVKLYVNGKEECSAGFAMPTAQIASPNSLSLAASSDGTNSWSGSVADFKLYSSDLLPLNSNADLVLINALYKMRF